MGKYLNIFVPFIVCIATFFDASALFKRSELGEINYQKQRLATKINDINNMTAAPVLPSTGSVFTDRTDKFNFNRNQLIDECKFMKNVLQGTMMNIAITNQQKKHEVETQISSLQIPTKIDFLLHYARDSTAIPFSVYLENALFNKTEVTLAKITYPLKKNQYYIFGTSDNSKQFELLVAQIIKEAQSPSIDKFSIIYVLTKLESLIKAYHELQTSPPDIVKKAYAERSINDLQPAINSIVNKICNMIRQRITYIEQWIKSGDISRIDPRVSARFVPWGISQNRAEYIFTEFNFYKQCFEIVQSIADQNISFAQHFNMFTNCINNLSKIFNTYTNVIKFFNLPTLVRNSAINLNTFIGSILGKKIGIPIKGKYISSMKDEYAKKMLSEEQKKEWLDLLNSVIIPKLTKLMQEFKDKLSHQVTRPVAGEGRAFTAETKSSGLLADFEVEKKRLTTALAKNERYKPIYITVNTFKDWQNDIDKILYWWVPEEMQNLTDQNKNSKWQIAYNTFYKPLIDFVNFVRDYWDTFQEYLPDDEYQKIGPIIIQILKDLAANNIIEFE